MDGSYSQLKEFAAGAGAYAKFVHGVGLMTGDFATADRLLNLERVSGDATNREMLAACFGAWLGEWAVENLAATWVGLHEPCAPRLSIGGVTCSPIDAVKRLFTNSTPQTSLAELAIQIQSWSNAAATANIISTNQAAWDRLAGDDRFAGELPLLMDRESALAAIDPWLAVDWQPGCRLLCLAAGGGRQGPLHALAGANVTVVDLSDKQLDHDQRVAAKHGLAITTQQCSAEHLIGLETAWFDVVIQPVSACYLPDLRSMYREVARVLRPGGVYLVQHKQPLSMRLQRSENGGYQLDEQAIDGCPLCIVIQSEADLHPTREPGTIEYGHSLHALIGELCDAGFVVTNFAEPSRADAFAPYGSAEHRACFAPPYFKLKAIRQHTAPRVATHRHDL